MRILVTGSREWGDEQTIRRVLGEIVALHGPENVTVVHGACPSGADALVDRIASAWTGMTVEPHPADWDSCSEYCPKTPHRVTKKPGDVDHPGELPDYCPRAGQRRNALMAGIGADVCLAFYKRGAKNYGTSNCVKFAKMAGIEVRRWSA